MSLRWMDVLDDTDCGTYLTGPFRVVGQYVCDRCDKMRCTLIVEHSSDEEYDDVRASLLQEDVVVPCPLADPPVRFRNIAPEDGGWQMHDACRLAYRTCPNCHMPMEWDATYTDGYKTYCPKCGHIELDVEKPCLKRDFDVRDDTQGKG